MTVSINFIHQKEKLKHVKLMLDQCNSMRACGQRYAGFENLAALMNLARPVTQKNYDKIVENSWTFKLRAKLL